MYIYIHIYICIYIIYKNFAFFVYRNIVATYMHTGHTGFTFTYIKVAFLKFGLKNFNPGKLRIFFGPNINTSKILSCPKLFPAENFRRKNFSFFLQ